MLNRRRMVGSMALWVGLLVVVPSVGAQLPDFTPLVERSKPAVVSVEVTREAPQSRQPGMGRDDEMEEFLRRFFGDPRRPGPQARPQQARGSGFIIDADGYILTNNHVVENASEVIVRMSDRRELEAEVVGSDPATDIALLKVDQSSLPVLPIGTSDDLASGEWVIAIGSPFNFDYTVTSGIVSAVGRSFPGQQYVPFIQTDVPINPGNSGGPLINMDGEVVGINSQIFSSSGGYMGLSFSIPVDVAMDVVGQLRDQGRVSRGYLGVVVEDVTASVAKFWGLDRATGALVSQVVDGSPAAAAGLQPGDIILKVGPREIQRQSALPPAVGMIRPGTSVPVEILRDQDRQVVDVTIQELDSDNPMANIGGADETDQAGGTLGLSVEDIDEELAQRLGVEGGVVVRRVMNDAARAGLRSGDVILMLGGTPVVDSQQFKRLIERYSDAESIPLLVQRGEIRRYLVVEKS